MKIVKAHSPVMPEPVLHNLISDGIAEVWIRKNIQQVTAPFEEGENLDYTYDEVYFQTTATLAEIEGDLETYWESGQGWEPEVPLTPEQKAEKLEMELKQANTALETAKADNDMAIAELTMVMAAMMSGVQEGGEDNV